MRADRRPHREKQWQSDKTVEILIRRSSKVMIERCIRRRFIVEMDQIHQRKCEIVENIGRGDRRIEFNGIEQQRPAVHERNIGQMKIAVATPYESPRGATLKQCPVLRQIVLAASSELFDGGDV